MRSARQLFSSFSHIRLACRNANGLTCTGEKPVNDRDDHDTRNASHADHAQNEGGTAQRGDGDAYGRAKGLCDKSRRNAADEAAEVEDDELCRNGAVSGAGHEGHEIGTYAVEGEFVAQVVLRCIELQEV